jgi:DNA-binding transcriptional LysR family regulator
MKTKRSRQRHPTKADLAADELLGAIRSCAQRLHAAAWQCDTLAPTITGFVEDIRSGFSTHDMPIDALREAAVAAGELTAICLLNEWTVSEALAKVLVRDRLFYDCELSK